MKVLFLALGFDNHLMLNHWVKYNYLNGNNNSACINRIMTRVIDFKVPKFLRYLSALFGGIYDEKS